MTADPKKILAGPVGQAGIFFLCNRKLRSYYTKMLRGDAHLAVRYIMPCIPLGRASVRQAHTLFCNRKNEKNNTIKHLQYTHRGYIMSLQMRNRNRLAGK